MIREVQVSDYEAICRISSEDLGYDCKQELVRMRIENLDRGREAVFVVEHDDRIIGYIHIAKYEVLYYDDLANILGLAVAKKYQKQGFGRKLVEVACRWAQENGACKVRLNSGMERPGAHQFYRALGFDEEKEQMRFMKSVN